MNSPREGIESVNLRSVDEPRVHNGPFTWVAVKSKYFLVAAMTGEGSLPFGGVRAQPTGIAYAADLVATLPAAADGTISFDAGLGGVTVKIQAWDWSVTHVSDGDGLFSFDGLNQPVTYTLSLVGYAGTSLDAPGEWGNITWVEFRERD